MEAVIRRAPTILDLLNAPVEQDILLQWTVWAAMVCPVGIWHVINLWHCPYLVDVDECLTSNGGCAQICSNVDGSFECSCGPDYVLDTDNFGCNCKTLKQRL